jgi:hypothetical protein
VIVLTSHPLPQALLGAITSTEVSAGTYGPAILAASSLTASSRRSVTMG